MTKFFRIFLYCLLLSLVSLSLAGLILWKTTGLKLYSIQTNSMSPVLQSGDLAASVKPARLQPGDIISYRSSNNSGQTISHRLVKIYPSRGYAITKGDNLTQADPAVPLSSITGKTVKVIPKAGYLTDILRRPAGLIGLVYLPALGLAAYELSRLMNHLQYRAYSLSGQKH